MSRQKDRPGPKGLVVPFRPRREADREPADQGERDQAAELSREWAAEIERLVEEPVGRRCSLIVESDPDRTDGDGDPATRLIGFLSVTGIGRLVMISRREGRTVITADRQTITRLVVWQAIDLGLDFRVCFD